MVQLIVMVTKFRVYSKLSQSPQIKLVIPCHNTHTQLFAFWVIPITGQSIFVLHCPKIYMLQANCIIRHFAKYRTSQLPNFIIYTNMYSILVCHLFKNFLSVANEAMNFLYYRLFLFLRLSLKLQDQISSL